MALKGYWAVCEDVRPPGQLDGKPTMSMIYIDGFFYAVTMGENRFEALNRATKKLSENIAFLTDCCADIPAPAYSDTPPDQRYKDGVMLVFISLADLGLEPSFFEWVPVAAE